MAKTYEELLEQAAIIRDETAAGKNTATRVGGTITDAVDYVKELQDTYKGIHAEAAAAKTEAAAAKTTAEQANRSATNAFDSARSAVLTANSAKATADGIAETAQEAREAAAAAQTAAQEAQTTAAALLQEIPWEGYHMNAFTDTGEYHIHGESTDANDGLPILNSGTIDARLTVLDSSLTRGTGEETDTVVTQILRLSNRMGGDGHVYVRTAQAANKSQLATPSSTAWGTWEKLMGMFEKNAVKNIADLDTYTTNGMYSGLFADTTLQTLGGLQFTPGDTFLLITVNGYAASAFGAPQLTQMLYRLPSKKGSGNNSARMYMRTAYWNKDADPKAWVWANWDRLATASEISGGGGGSIEELNRLNELIAANTEKISSVESTANSAKSAAETAKTAANAAQETANSASETATAASTAAQEAKSAADNAQSTANGKQDALTLTVKDNGNIVLANIQGQSKEFMPATPSGDPMHYAFVTAGAEYNDTGADIVKDAPWADMLDDDYTGDYGKTVVHKAGHWYLNGLGDITNEEIREIYYTSSNIILNYGNTYDYFSPYYNIRTMFQLNAGVLNWTGNLKIKSSQFCHSMRKCIVYNVFYNNNNGIILEQSTTNNIFQYAIMLIHSLTPITLKSKIDNDFGLSSCSRIVTIKIKGIGDNLIIAKTPVLSMKSVLYMINNEAATSPITITLHADVYNRCMANEDILAALAAHTNISLASK